MAVTMDSHDESRKSIGRFWVEGRWNRWRKDGLGKGLSGSRLGNYGILGLGKSIATNYCPLQALDLALGWAGLP